MTIGVSKPCRYTVIYEGEEVVQYETSADPRTAGGRVGLRNIICRHMADYDKVMVNEQLSTEISEHVEAVANEFGPK